MPTELESSYVDPGLSTAPPDSVVLDIGGDVGALIVYTTEDWIGFELDLTPAGERRSHQVHTGVRRLRLIGRDVFAAVYPDVVEGGYTVWGPDGPLGEVEVTGGAVAEFGACTCRIGSSPDHDGL